MEPVTLADLGNFLQKIIRAYDSYLFFAFVLMMTLSVALGVRRLLLGVKS
ncbi:hypothetical protein OB894_12930 [Bacillus subtilis]|nr:MULTISPECIES: hypothetical protein [Bacilli]MCY7936313.1 hypothetical protein [Bacillus spizizenii]MCY8867412.1 hypothetical protein [Bacillus spizizenii]MCY9426155.1 hypothetical protein [Bacillus spizizenii]MCY9429230.1 hypothetical protein [Bacillus spizizenii]MDQ4712334.1 hypothetical protein [Bacillus subtilis]